MTWCGRTSTSRRAIPYVRASVDKDVLSLYATGFFLNIRVSDQMTDKGVELTYVLQGKLKLTGINFEGNTKFSRFEAHEESEVEGRRPDG